MAYEKNHVTTGLYAQGRYPENLLPVSKNACYKNPVIVNF